MRRKNRASGEVSENSWLITYAGLITLLLIFFAVLLSMSSVDREKYAAFISSFTVQAQDTAAVITNPSAETANAAEALADAEAEQAEKAMSDLYEKLNDYVDRKGITGAVSLSRTNQVILIKLDSSAVFEPENYVLLPEGQDIVSFIGGGIKEYESLISFVAISGHNSAANDNPVSGASDWMLIGEQAAATAMVFEKENGIASEKMLLLSFGKNLSVLANNTEEDDSAKQRVEIVIVGTASDNSFDPYSDLNKLYGLMESGTSDTSAPAENNAQANSTPDIEYDVSPYE